MRRIADEKLDMEAKVRDRPKVAFQHRPVTGEPNPLAVVAHLLADIAAELVPVLAVEAGDVAAIGRHKLIPLHRFPRHIVPSRP